MIDLVLFHSFPSVGYDFDGDFEGSRLPKYIEFSFHQIRLFNPNIKIYFLTDEELLEDILFKKYNIVPLNKNIFYSDKIKEFEFYFNYNPNNFWSIAATRLIYIENFLKNYNLENVYHFENDVLLYYNLEEHHEKFIKFYENLAITTGAPDKSMTGFVFIKNGKSLSMMTQFFIDTLKKYGIFGTQQKYGMDMVHEMSLIKFYGIENGEFYLDNLPILPFGELSKNYNIFDSIFDPASWGQFVGGTRYDGPGAKPPDQYIGRLLMQNPEWRVDFLDIDGFKIPHFNYNGKFIKINNLHIHSKNLHLYMSKNIKKL